MTGPRKVARFTILAAVLSLAVLLPAAGQTEGTIDTDEDSLFGGSDDLFGGDPLVTEIEESGTDFAATLLTSEGVEIGGRFAMGLNANYGWNDISTLGDTLLEPDTSTFSTPLSAQLFFDARPEEDFRVFGKMTASYPFDTDPDDPDDPADPVRELADVFHVDELFSDFNWGDRIYFRAGKQTMNWGVGYFYSPADLLSLAEVDPEDPEAEREGPVAVKANVPSIVNNWYFYVIPAFAEEALDTGLALKYELVLGGAELALGGIYQRDVAPAAMTTVSGSFRQFDLFAEAVASYGSNRTYVRTSDTAPLGVETYTRTGELVFSATAGGRWIHSFEGSDSSVMVLAQYLYNGDGYSDAAFLADNPVGIAALIAAGDLRFADLQNLGRHYSAVQASWTDVLGTGVNGGIFWMQNYSDISGRLVPSLSRTFLERFTLSVQVPISLGDAGDELSPTGNALGLGLSLSVGGGSF